jgi:hypothetical protein
MRGVMGIEVPAVKITKLGIKYDREWAIYSKDNTGKLRIIHPALDDSRMVLLRQKIEKDMTTKDKYLVISVID